MLMVSRFLCCTIIYRAMFVGMFMDSCIGSTKSTQRPWNVTEMHWKLIQKTFKFHWTCHFCKCVLLTLHLSFLPNLSSSLWSHESFGYRCLSCLRPSPTLLESFIGVQTFCTLPSISGFSVFYHQNLSTVHVIASNKCLQQEVILRLSQTKCDDVFQAQTCDLAGCVETRRQLLMIKPSHHNNWIGFAVAHHMSAEWDSCILLLNGQDA